MPSSRLAAVSALLVLGLAGCSGDEEPGDDAEPTASTPGTPGTSESATPPAEPARLAAVPGGASVCIDDLRKGDVVAFTGPAVSVEGSPATVSDVRIAGGDLRIVKSGSVLATLGQVRQPALVTGDDLEGLDPRGRPDVPGSVGDLVGRTFEPGEEGFVPLVEVRVAWPATAARRAATSSWRSRS